MSTHSGQEAVLREDNLDVCTLVTEQTLTLLPGGVGQFEDDIGGKHEPNSGNRSADSVRRALRREWRPSDATAAKISRLGDTTLLCTTE
jgi:hypothetical protein